MSVDIEFRILGIAKFQKKILAVDERGQDMRPVFRRLAYKWLNWNLLQFETEGGRSGRPWAPLKPSTVKRRGNAHPILKVTGSLEDALIDRGNVDIGRRVMQFKIKSPREEKLAGIHYSGKSPLAGARRPIDFNRADHREITQDLQAWLTSGRL